MEYVCGLFVTSTIVLHRWLERQYTLIGLGKWLKAEMMFFVRDELPEARYINTGNADTNAAMVAINERMGFKRYQTELCFRFELEALHRLVLM
jgi:hypothetical protein